MPSVESSFLAGGCTVSCSAVLVTKPTSLVEHFLLPFSTLTLQQKLINATTIATMKKGVCIANVARGEVVDEQAIADAVKSGHIMRAALDVFSPEPLSKDSPLLTLDNIIVTPHLGASTKEAQVKVAVDVVEQIITVCASFSPSPSPHFIARSKSFLVSLAEGHPGVGQLGHLSERLHTAACSFLPGCWLGSLVSWWNVCRRFCLVLWCDSQGCSRLLCSRQLERNNASARGVRAANKDNNLTPSEQKPLRGRPSTEYLPSITSAMVAHVQHFLQMVSCRPHIASACTGCEEVKCMDISKWPKFALHHECRVKPLKYGCMHTSLVKLFRMGCSCVTFGQKYSNWAL